MYPCSTPNMAVRATRTLFLPQAYNKYNSCHADSILGNKNCIWNHFSTLSWHMYGSWNILQWKTIIHLSCIVNAVGSVSLATQGAMVSAAMVLT